MSKPAVLIVSANTVTFPTPAYPLALPQLAAVVRDAGFRPVQVDLLVDGPKALVRACRETAPALVALSLRNIDSVDSVNPAGYIGDYGKIMEVLRENTTAPVVLGGSGFSLFPGELLARLGGDLGVIGQGEDAVRAMLSAISRGETLEGFPPISNGNAAGHAEAPLQLRTLHRPDLVAYYWERAGMIGLLTKSGCPRRCVYCTYPDISGKRPRCASAGAVADEVERLYRDHGVHFFFVVDAVFNLGDAGEAAFAEELCRRNLRLSWGAFFAPRDLDAEHLQLLKRSGLTHMEFGTDALCDEVLVRYGKGFTVAEALRAAEAARAAGIHCAHYLILGGPGETVETVAETVRAAAGLRSAAVFPFAGMRLYPGTPLYETAVAEGVVNTDTPLLDPVFYFAPGLDGATVWNVVGREAQGGASWVLPHDYGRLAQTMARLRQRGVKGPLWEYAIH